MSKQWNTVFDITEFGAVGDGQTVCTDAIQQALDAAAACRGTVLVPPGVYLTGELHMGAGTSLEGHSAWSFRSNGASILRLCDPDAKCLLDITGAFGCTVRGVCMDGARLGEKIHGIYLFWEKYNGGSEEDTPTIDDCRIGSFTGNGVHLEHIWCFSVRHSMLHHNKGAGLYIDGWDAFIIDNWFSGNYNYGILGGPVVASITVTGNRVEWNNRAGFLFRAGDSYNITGNFFDRSGGPAMLLGTEKGGCTNITVSSNIFRRSGKPNPTLVDPLNSCHLRMMHCDNVTVTGNAFRLGKDDGGKGELSPQASIVADSNTYCVIKDNVLHGGHLGEAMILTGDHSTCVIKDNLY